MKKIFAICFSLFAVSFVAVADDAIIRPSRGVSSNTTDNAVPARGQTDSVRQSRGALISGQTPVTKDNESVSRTSVRSRPDGDTTNVRGTTERGVVASRQATSRLRPSVAEVGGRAIIGRTNTMTGSNVDEEVQRKLGVRSRAADTMQTMDVEAPSSSNDLSECSASYFDCLDQFCNVLDANQKQCSCSSHLSDYKRVEDSLKKANSELNNVAQQIRYVGLSADEVRSIMKETEAETVLSSTKDTTQSRNMLEQIEDIIESPTSNSFTSSSSSSGNLDFELDFSGDASSFDLDSMLGNNTSFANMRGTDLYNAAKKKCSSILSRCTNKKADQNIISGQYDVEIDKACIAYEAGLQKASDGVKTNIKTATQMLQKARLAVLNDQNTYDAKGCVSALDACMRDDMVCGDKYYKCLDPTKTAIDESGEVIAGGDLVRITAMMKDYTNAEVSDTILDASTASACSTNKTDGTCIIYYLLSRIGKMDESTKHVTSGFCRPVLEKCQRYTYDSNKKYNEKNTIVKSYLQRTMTQIKASQANIIVEHASECITDVSTCYNSQITQVNSYSSGLTLSPSTVKPILMGACRNVALSCAYAVFSDPSDNGADKCWTDSTTRNANNCINQLSSMFYQSMLCPANSEWNNTASSTPAINNTLSDGSSYVNSNCQCKSGYYVYNGTCLAVASCTDNSAWTNNTTIAVNNALGGVTAPYCQCNAGYYVYNGACISTPTCPAYSTWNSADEVSANNVTQGIVAPYCKCNVNYKTYNGTCIPVT